ncbi:ShlB/FhaC/HecB family hemolysin secretion/activation protein [Methylosinus sporium]|uniref:ShlB/FhaC/HecB family hemolysin secretion/activation protein n=1 Tax=Methylosinus sporium TaxID=428 RepID=A0A549SZK9_METSR|nr:MULTISPECIES: ShlB/FhaC/HecB family hemolysin secretion/activation protein [Methylosinus]MBU3890753.1 ShlB/FhaC/HecB family hemolysin secretion/activation protein [Methylosinus sp. KRF6]TRL35072.1 ShlB/FhaC/HecB family hemolysin secretion/activation protein [Methylosinus sporium]
MNFRCLLLSCVAAPALLLAAPQAFAQSAPTPILPYNIGDAVRQAEEARPAPPRQSAPTLPQIAEPRFTLASKETLFVKHFVVEGPLLVQESELREILAPYEGRKLTLGDIYGAADKVTLLYRAKGFLVAKAYVPAQDARSGSLKIKLVVGKYGSVLVENSSAVDAGFLQGVVDTALADEALIHKDALERALLLVSDLPGAGAPRIVVSPGKSQETSDFQFAVPEGKRVAGYLLGDNFGSPYTGRDRLNGGFVINSPLGFGDRLSGSAIVSERAALANGRVAYSFPLGYDGLRAEVGAYRTTYALGGAYKDLDATGSAYAITGTLNYALVRQREESISLWANFTHKWLDDRIAGTSTSERKIALGTIGVTRETAQELLGLPLATSAMLSFTSGYVDYPDVTQRTQNSASVDTVGNFHRINLAVSATVAFDEKFSLSTYLRAQKALDGNLDTSEQFSLGGFWGVRSFDEGLAGDSGYFVTPELKYALPQIENYRHALGVFTDIGAVWLENGSYTTTQRSYTGVNDVGVGYYATYDIGGGSLLVLKAQAAHTYGTNSGATAYDRHTKGLLQVGFTF